MPQALLSHTCPESSDVVRHWWCGSPITILSEDTEPPSTLSLCCTSESTLCHHLRLKPHSYWCVRCTIKSFGQGQWEVYQNTTVTEKTHTSSLHIRKHIIKSLLLRLPIYPKLFMKLDSLAWKSDYDWKGLALHARSVKCCWINIPDYNSPAPG